MPSYATGYTKLALEVSNIEEKAMECGAPVVYINPKNTSKLCPVHGASILYDNSTRIGRCNMGGELWRRDAAACWNIFFRALWGDGGSAPSPAGLNGDVPRVPFGANAAHDPTALPKGLWARRKLLEATLNNPKAPGMIL